MAGSDRLVVGVDFGTTFSGWPGANGSTSDKVPTQISYKAGLIPQPPQLESNLSDLGSLVALTPASQGQSNRPRWGYQLKSDEEKLLCFKLFLDNEHNFPSYVSKKGMLLQLHKYGKSAEQVAGDFLTKVFDHAKSELIVRYGSTFVSETKLEIVLTVPAIWPDKAKDATLKAAEQAGMGTDIKMVSEPEAAAVYTLRSLQPNGLKPGDNLIVCDAGGGTVDIISYEIKQLDPLRIQESAPGTGSCCGSVILNIRFEDLVRNKLGDKTFDSILKRHRRSWENALKYFEEYVKRCFDPTDTTEFNIPFPGVRDRPQLGLDGGFLTLSSLAIGSIFKPVVSGIGRLVRDQVERLGRANKPVSAIILVGGFGQSNCLYKYLSGKFSKSTAKCRIEIMQPANAWTAVVRGSVLHGLEVTELVLARKARRHYGVRFNEIFDPSKHSESRKIMGLDDRLRASDQMEWYINKGQTVSSTKPIIFTFHRSLRASDSRKISDALVVCDSDNAPDVYDWSAGAPTRNLCTLIADLADVPQRFWIVYTNKSGERIKRLEYQLGMYIDGGGLRHDLRVDGVVYGEVMASFD